MWKDKMRLLDAILLGLPNRKLDITTVSRHHQLIISQLSYFSITSSTAGASLNACSMSADLLAKERDDVYHAHSSADNHQTHNTTQLDPDTDEEEENDDDDDEEEEEGEPKLKYAKLTGSLTNLYRNGDSTSTFTIAGDKMVVGTHNGNVHILTMPALQTLRTYHAHSATITGISVSPIPPPPSWTTNTTRETESSNLLSAAASTRTPSQTTTTPRTTTSKPQPNTPSVPPTASDNLHIATASNNLHIATSSLDGHICITSLLDPKDVQLRNFARPVQTLALSPDYRHDRTFLSGGRAGQLILTVGGRTGVTVDANTNPSAATSSGGGGGGFLGAFGLGADRGKDTVLHEGEGAISALKWSRSRKWVVWVNEEGIKIMRSHLRLGSEESEDAWRRIAHAARPNKSGWEEMVGVWRASCVWVDEKGVEEDDVVGEAGEGGVVVNGTGAAKKNEKKPERLLVGWGNFAWLLHVTESSPGTKTTGGKRVIGTADVMQKLQMQDCIVAGISLYTPSLLAILAYRTTDDDGNPVQQQQTQQQADGKGAGKKGRHRHRHTGLAPQLRLVDVETAQVEEIDELSISRFETLSAQDYWLGTLYMPPPPPTTNSDKAGGKKGALEGLWDAAGGKYASRVFSSTASVMTKSSSGKEENGKLSVASPAGSAKGVVPPPAPSAAAAAAAKRRPDAHPFASSPGLKLFIQSPFDCVLAVKRDRKDHLSFLLKASRYAEAWKLVDQFPEVVDASGTAEKEADSPTPRVQEEGTLADFLADERASSLDGLSSTAEREKRRIGELWLLQLVSAGQWSEAGNVAGKVLSAADSRWEHWVLTFAQAGKFDEITPHIPPTAQSETEVTEAAVAIPTLVYEVVLGHYISADPQRLRSLLDVWEPETGLYDIGSVSAAIGNRLDSDDVQRGTPDWTLLLESLAKLDLADGRAHAALKCYIQVQNADAAMKVIREEKEKLADVVAPEDVPGLLMLRVSKEQMRSAPLGELEEASREAVALLVEEAHRGTVTPGSVIRELENQDRHFQPFLFFYLRALWHGVAADTTTTTTNQDDPTPQPLATRRKHDLHIAQGHALVEDHADLAVNLFAEYDRALLLTFLRTSDVYSYERAAALCEQRHYIPELVHVLAKTGQTKRALFLIIGQLADVSQAIAFVKENPDLWDDLLEYSMDKPAFIRGLLEEVGTAIDPRELVRRIPEGLEIEGLREGMARLMRACEVQFSISEGVARVLRGEVGGGMDVLRRGQRRGVRFEVLRERVDSPSLHMLEDGKLEVPAGNVPDGNKKEEKGQKHVQPGHCVGCGDVFHEDGTSFPPRTNPPPPSSLRYPLKLTPFYLEKEPLIGLACGHVYHLSCLLKANPDTSDPATLQRLQNQLGYGATGGDADEAGYTGRSVGAKVAHAGVVRGVLRGGCRVCHDAGN